MPTVLGGVAVLIVAAYAANITGDADAVGWVLLATPFVLPVGAFVLWLVLTVLRFIFVWPRKE
jgi:uncharacterized membrane-anchored protein